MEGESNRRSRARSLMQVDAVDAFVRGDLAAAEQLANHSLEAGLAGSDKPWWKDSRYTPLIRKYAPHLQDLYCAMATGAGRVAAAVGRAHGGGVPSGHCARTTLGRTARAHNAVSTTGRMRTMVT